MKNKRPPIPIGPYDPEAKKGEAYQFVDEYDFCASDSHDQGRGDSLGGNVDMYYAYNDARFVYSSEKMWYWNEKGKYIGQRHPEVSPEEHPMSRDHYHSTLSLLKMHYDRTGSNASMMKIKEITDNTGYIISKMARRGFGLKWWSEAIQGKKFYQLLWHIIGIIQGILVYRPLTYIGGKIIGFDEEVDQEDYIPYPGPRLQDFPKWKQKLHHMMYPAYALQMVGWKLHVLDKLPLMRKLHKAVYRPMVGKTSYVQQMLFGMEVPREKIETFRPMKGGRWGGYLSNRNDRDMRVLLPEPTVNRLDCDVARKLFNETQL